MNSDASKLKEVKLLISGLDNAGKTSSLIALRHKYNFFEKVNDLSPTIKIEYSSFDFLKNWKILLWDMGGQEKYREIYMNKPIYFNDTNFFYFFIDIQDHYRYNSAINYLSNLLEILEKTGFSNEVVVCLHKYDPNIRDDEEINSGIDEIKKQIQQLNETQLKFKFIKTSLYDISSLSKAVSYSLNKLINLEPIRVRLRNIVKKYNGKNGILYTQSGLILADFFHGTLDAHEYDLKIRSDIHDDLILFQKLADFHSNFNERISNFDGSQEYLKKLTINKNTLYLKMTISDSNGEEIQEDIEEFKKNLMILLP